MQIVKRGIKSMPYVITNCWYPPHLAQKVAQKYLDTMQKYPIPSTIKRVVPAASTSFQNGIKVLNVDEVKQEDLGDVMDYAGKFMVEFYEIEGFRYEINVYSTISEALKNIGMG